MPKVLGPGGGPWEFANYYKPILFGLDCAGRGEVARVRRAGCGDGFPGRTAYTVLVIGPWVV
jgi:hypothetical protein